MIIKNLKKIVAIDIFTTNQLQNYSRAKLQVCLEVILISDRIVWILFTRQFYKGGLLCCLQFRKGIILHIIRVCQSYFQAKQKLSLSEIAGRNYKFKQTKKHRKWPQEDCSSFTRTQGLCCSVMRLHTSHISLPVQSHWPSLPLTTLPPKLQWD